MLSRWPMSHCRPRDDWTTTLDMVVEEELEIGLALSFFHDQARKVVIAAWATHCMRHDTARRSGVRIIQYCC